MNTQTDLFAAAPAASPPKAGKKGFEVHEHCFIRGNRANKSWLYKFSHSHEGGDVPHQHPDTGPASYTIDKDDWARATGLSGGGRKKFTTKPTGEQFPRVELERSQTEFEIIVGAPPTEFIGEGPGIAPAARMILGFGMRVAGIRSAPMIPPTLPHPLPSA